MAINDSDIAEPLVDDVALSNSGTVGPTVDGDGALWDFDTG